ncbi:MAG: nuclear transport factor 2 family protein [Ilumatobacter sp.]|uniref:ester cyclase n=1 Tax=Ilumatobacter sp. TaxID=1967498 RepID=UPI002634BAE2|nr:nuclear transport factor 2 family protein [Ilumatobacter sp.]MDJ0771193.1 nuclear transport factor 2 family protein [Ilumatobacter sp.]
MASEDEFRGEPIDSGELEVFSGRYFDAWNSHAPAQVAALATEDVVWNSPAFREPGRGRQAVIDLVATTVVAFPDYVFSRPSAPAIAEDGVTAYVPWHMTGTNTGSFEPPGYAPTGKAIDLPGIDVWCFRDGLIWRYQAVYDYAVIGRQLGLALPRGGRLERAAVRAQRLLVGVRHRLHS